MDALMYCLRTIREEIPEAVINAAVTLDEPEGLEELQSIDELIMLKVIRPRVLLDMKLAAQRELVVPLTGIAYKVDYYNNMIWKIPKDRLQNLDIITPLGIGISVLPSSDFFNPNIGMTDAFGVGGVVRGGGCFGGNTLTNASDQMRGSYERPNIGYNTDVTLIGPNTVLLKGNTFMMTSNLVLRCKVDNDPKLNNIPPKSWRTVAEACVLAFKAYAYKILYLGLDGGLLQFGQEFGRFDQIVESYSDANEDYKEFLRMRLDKVLVMSDTETYNKILGTMIDPFA